MNALESAVKDADVAPLNIIATVFDNKTILLESAIKYILSAFDCPINALESAVKEADVAPLNIIARNNIQEIIYKSRYRI
jgi:hypothetical protein